MMMMTFVLSGWDEVVADSLNHLATSSDDNNDDDNDNNDNNIVFLFQVGTKLLRIQ